MMADPGDRPSDASGGLVRHIPVLLSAVLEALAPVPGQIVLDGTFGAGGYTQALLDAGAQVIALDRDPHALESGDAMVERSGGRLSLHAARFSELDRFAPDAGLDGVVLDIGVSSMQLDTPERGFSFRADGPLDMRMANAGVSAADVVNQLAVGDLARIFNFLGEEKQAGRIAGAIVRRREAEGAFETTRDLARLVETVSPRKAKDRIHPATRVFQALRVYVNDELGELARALYAAERALKPGGRLVVVTFHSLEDRIVKRFFQNRFGGVEGSRHLPQPVERPSIFTRHGKAMVTASAAEAEANPRARSAKLRVGVRTDEPAGEPDMSIFGLPKLVPLNSINV
ncbi:16S rRNA (cytosine(1402)-N(4))-methyltransferase RsmH [Pararhizobium mangrovi]|uniref:16S rRNA (cytosine(1402)-N(4))-methyltransferase RsmH n=1 Tax=Pararhizobium mangrovi TaxID=2590452 RepID=UPI001F2E07C2|nr:16S rRNA (cytosine(1402)-N(4))-methyltransferase RsmH [Pararhizobium mangrovi]